MHALLTNCWNPTTIGWMHARPDSSVILSERTHPTSPTLRLHYLKQGIDNLILLLPHWGCIILSRESRCGECLFHRGPLHWDQEASTGLDGLHIHIRQSRAGSQSLMELKLQVLHWLPGHACPLCSRIASLLCYPSQPDSILNFLPAHYVSIFLKWVSNVKLKISPLDLCTTPNQKRIASSQ